MIYLRTSSIFVLALSILAVFSAYSKVRPASRKSLKYRTSFGACPSRSAGTLTLKLVKEFEKNNSLRDVKLKMVEEKLAGKHFISSYKINYNPMKNLLGLTFDCPAPLMKVQVYKEGGVESYDAILVETGKLYDPTYEVLLKNEKKLKGELPFLALPVGQMNDALQQKITGLVKSMPGALRRKISEVIVSDEKELTIILSINGHPTSVFVGGKEWEAKSEKLHKIIKYLEKKQRIPAVINLTNAKKIVVKFNDKF